MTEEVWRDIKDYEGLYQISSLGRVRSLDRFDSIGRFIKGKMLSYNVDKDGYSCITLCKNGGEKKCKVHRIVAQTFIPNPDNKPCIDHINCERSDNRIENLKWCTHSENLMNPITRKKKSNICREICQGSDNPNSKKIIQFSKNGDLIRLWECMKDAADNLGTNYQNISKCCRGIRKHFRDSIFEYYDTDRYLIALMIKTLNERKSA